MFAGQRMDVGRTSGRARIVAAAVVFAAFAASLAARHAPAAEVSAAEIVAKNVATRGGLDAWRKIETMVWSGHIESAHAPAPSMQFVLEQKRPNKTRLQIRALGETSMRVFDGAQGWTVRTAGGRPQVQPYSAEESTFASAGHGIDGPLIDAAAKGRPVTLEGLEEIGGRRAYHLLLRTANGGVEHVWVDADTYLEVRDDRISEGAAGAQRRVSVTYGDYRTVDGLKIPFLIETGGGPGAKRDKVQIETVALNAPVDDARFGNPAAAHASTRPASAFPSRANVPTALATAPNEARDDPGEAGR